MRIIFMGTPDFSVGTLEALVRAGHQIVLTVTQPDKPRGRSGKMQAPPVKKAAVKYGIPVYQPERIRRPECLEELHKYPADVVVVVAFGQILPREILEMTPYGCINVHASLLPSYRGAAPIQWAILEGEKMTGVTTMQMDEGLDTGDMLLKTEIPITEGETGGSLHDKLALAGAALCVKTLEQMERGQLSPQKQGESPTGYAVMLSKDMGQIHWEQGAEEIDRQIRGLSPWPGTFTAWEGKQMKIWKADLVRDTMGLEPEQEPGTVLVKGKQSFTVQTGKGWLEIKELQLPGKKRVDAGAFLRGYELEIGDRLGG